MTELPNRLLREVLADTASTSVSPGCVDVETLAAWADGTISGAERTAIEAHAAGCARCLALLAAMARTEPPPSEPWWRTRLAWALPLATATATLAIVAGLALVERRLQVPQRPPTAAASDAAAEQPSPAAAPPAAAVSAPPAGAAAVPATTATPAAGPAPRRRDRSPRETTASKAEVVAKEAAAPPTAVVEPPPPVAAPAAPAQAAQAAASADVRSEAGRGERGLVSGAQPMLKAIAPPLVVFASPDRGSQWRLAGGAVEHSTDGGQSWQRASIGVATPILAGAAPAAGVCWLAGSGGVVLRTSDGGATWTRIAFPGTADLTAVEAADALHATVTDAAGRRLSTSDGGATWRPRSP